MTAIPFPRPVHSADPVTVRLDAIDERLATFEERLYLLYARTEQVLDGITALRNRIDADAASDAR